MQSASDLYFASQDGEIEDAHDDSEQHEQQEKPTASSSSSSAPALQPNPSTSSSSNATGRKPPPPSAKPKFGSLRDLQKRSEENENSSDSDKEQEFFAGGDKSGLAVQDPSQHGPTGGSGSGDGDDTAPGPPNEDPHAQMNRLIRQAQRQHHFHHPPDQGNAVQRRSNFSGPAQTLGGDDMPSRRIEMPASQRGGAPGGQQPAVSRTLHLWRNGFSVDAGPLHPSNEPENQAILRLIQQGQAPLSIMAVEPGQQVDVRLEPHLEEDYKRPKGIYRAFAGEGRRLGSPVPGEETPTTAVAAAATAPVQQQSSTGLKEEEDKGTSVDVDDSQPILSLQLRLADGTRLPARFNETHTVGDVYAFVDRAAPGRSEGHVLATTFPTKELTEMDKALGEMGLGRGGVVVQKRT